MGAGLTAKQAGPTGMDARHVDLTSVKDLRKALRRKFASRSNLDKVFSQWDIGNKGEISTTDLLNGLKKLNIVSNHEQAAVLLASAQKAGDQAGGLSKQSFGDLLFNADDTFKVDLSSIPVPSWEEKRDSYKAVKRLHQPKVLDLASLSEGQREQFRARNTWRYCIQKNWR